MLTRERNYPAAWVHGPDGELMLDDLRGDGFAILVQDGRTLQAVTQLRHHLLSTLTPRLVRVEFNGHALIGSLNRTSPSPSVLVGTRC